jgi:hypothetical protein
MTNEEIIAAARIAVQFDREEVSYDDFAKGYLSKIDNTNVPTMQAAYKLLCGKGHRVISDNASTIARTKQLAEAMGATSHLNEVSLADHSMLELKLTPAQTQ